MRRPSVALLTCCAVDPRSQRPPLDYTSGRGREAGPLQLSPIGWIESPYTERFGTPRQPTVATQVLSLIHI